jgi:hypothetical protein
MDHARALIDRSRIDLRLNFGHLRFRVTALYE